MENPDVEEWNHDACVEAPHNCYDGLIHVGECQGGVPVSMSAPFFYNGDERLGGLDFFDPPLVANKDAHDTILDLDPVTSIALNAHKRIQVCLYSVLALKKIKEYSNELYHC